jgi:hypothetical protein
MKDTLKKTYGKLAVLIVSMVLALVLVGCTKEMAQMANIVTELESHASVWRVLQPGTVEKTFIVYDNPEVKKAALGWVYDAGGAFKHGGGETSSESAKALLNALKRMPTWSGTQPPNPTYGVNSYAKQLKLQDLSPALQNYIVRNVQVALLMLSGRVPMVTFTAMDGDNADAFDNLFKQVNQ